MTGELTPLQLGITAIQAHNDEEARKQLIQAISNDPENAEPWLWLGVVASTLDERIQYLEQAVSLQPDNDRANVLLDKLRHQQIEMWIKEGISEIRAGNTVHGADLLTKVVNSDESQLEAWWWLGQATISPKDKAVCYENVLTLDPDHSGAQLALQSLRQIESEESMDLFHQEKNNTNFGFDVDFHDRPSTKLPEGKIEPQLFSDNLDQQDTYSDPLESVLACPFCAEITDFKDKRCSQCKRNLFHRQREISRSKRPYRILIGLECSIIIFGILVSFIMLGFVDMFVQAEDNMLLLQTYLLPNKQIVNLGNDVAFTIISPIAFNTALVPSLIASLIIVSILFRWQPMFYFAIGISTIRIMVCILTIILVINGLTTNTTLLPDVPSDNIFLKPMQYSLYGAIGITLLLSGIAFFMLINTHDHFSYKNTRRLLQLDDNMVGNSTGLRQRARVYAKEKAWALTALHARESILLRQEVEGYTLLATAYYHLGWHKNVSQTLNEALEFSPQNTQLLELQEVLDHQMTTIPV